MAQQIVSAIHQLVAILSLAAWALAMYYWHLTNTSLIPGASKLTLLNPTNYAKNELFTSVGLKYRRSTVLCFAAMLVLGAVAYLLRILRDAIT
jgi:hypothetical protein